MTASYRHGNGPTRGRLLDRDGDRHPESLSHAEREYGVYVTLRDTIVTVMKRPTVSLPGRDIPRWGSVRLIGFVVAALVVLREKAFELRPEFLPGR